MLNLDEINRTIQELENGITNFDTCQKLAWLYTIKQYHDNYPVNSVADELKDILPEYKKYIKIKKKYQKKELTESAVILSMQNVCTEIKQFIRTLYSSTDMPEEREQIKAMLSNLNQSF